MKEQSNVLITGAYGMLGRYVRDEFSNSGEETRLFSLGRRPENDFVCSLDAEAPDFGDTRFDTVVHCAGTEEAPVSMQLNLEGTRRLLASLNETPPRHFVYVSSFRVYNPDEGTDITEDSPSSGSGTAGESKALAEKDVTEWCRRHGVILTVIRPARMFGSGVGGETLRLFNDAINGRYIHIRGNDARVSLVAALDVAKAIKAVHTRGGVFNASDGRSPLLIEMVEAMTANAGRQKRMTHLPATWAEWLWRTCRWVPIVDRNLNPATVTDRMKTLTLNSDLLAKTSGITFHDTIKVISRTDPTYPYSE